MLLSDVMEFTWTYTIKAEEARRFRFCLTVHTVLGVAQIRLPCADAVEIAYYLSLAQHFIRMARTNTERDKVWMRRRARVPPLLGSGSAGAGYVRLTGFSR